ncbi:H-NS family nucleoid-associated regulatory protein [Roseateles sp. So40a]|uniref:H-NS family nucleoid-associated regulatory protein n=1 Tax=Roseateles sp. So40a TaxID=3400226 RepID=UPI003A845217
MAKSLKQVLEQIDKLQMQAKTLRAKEVAGVVARIQEAIRHYSLTPEELFGPSLGASAKSVRSGKGAAKRKGAASAKYSDGTNSWGGMGKRPRWFNEALAAGKTKEELLVQPSVGEPGRRQRKAGKPSTPRKNSGIPKFHNGEGLTWTGRGKRPAWFIAALEGGKTADDLLIK